MSIPATTQNRANFRELTFGEILRGGNPITKNEKIKFIGAIALGILAFALITALAGTGIGAVVATCIANSVIAGMQIGALAGLGLGLFGALTVLAFLKKK